MPPFSLRIGGVSQDSGFTAVDGAASLLDALQNGTGGIEVSNDPASLVAAWDPNHIVADGDIYESINDLPPGFKPTAAAVTIENIEGGQLATGDGTFGTNEGSPCVITGGPSGDVTQLGDLNNPIGTHVVEWPISSDDEGSCGFSGAAWTTFIKLETLTDPGNNLNHVFSISARVQHIAGGLPASHSTQATLYAGPTGTTADDPIKSLSSVSALGASWTTRSATLTSSEVDDFRAAGGYANAWIRITTSQQTTSGACEFQYDYARAYLQIGGGPPSFTLELESQIPGGGSASGDDCISPGIIYDFSDLTFPEITISRLLSYFNSIYMTATGGTDGTITGPLVLNGTYELVAYSWYIRPTEQIINGEPVTVIEDDDIIWVNDDEEPPDGYELYGTGEDYPSGPVFMWWYVPDSTDSFWIFSPISPGPDWVLLGGVPSCAACITLTLGELEILIANASGVYYLQSGQRVDTLYVRDEASEQVGTVDVKIPNPRARTGLLP